MTTAYDMLKSMKRAKKPSEHFEDVARENEALFAEKQREQLAAGRDNTGDYLPRYSDDLGKFFKTPAAVYGYTKFKQRVSPNKSKPADVMDFYIDGTYHREIIAEVRDKNLAYYNSTPYAASVEAKAPGKILGLNPETARPIVEDVLMPEVITRISEETGIITK